MILRDRRHLRDRFLAEQQTQLAEDCKLADPARAYEALLDELEADRDQRDPRRCEQAA